MSNFPQRMEAETLRRLRNQGLNFGLYTLCDVDPEDEDDDEEDEED